MERDTDKLPINFQLLESSELLPGDILLYRPTTPSKIDISISSSTNSPYTHAAIYTGENKIAESVFPSGVTVSDFDKSLDGYLYVCVLRTQMGFGPNRQEKLQQFVDDVVSKGIPFHISGLVHFGAESRAYFDGRLEFVRNNYGRHQSFNELTDKAYFCSGFVTACYEAVGIIDETAQAAFRPEFFSPAHLYEEGVFGWLLGYIMADGTSVTTDDPTLYITNWSDLLDHKWWD